MAARVISLMMAGSVALLVAAFLTPVLIKWLLTRQIGQHIREDGPASHFEKAGTPTMGGVVIILAVVLGYLSGHLSTSVPFNAAGALVVMTVVGYGVVGFADDYIKVVNKRSLGLNKRAKLGGQLLVGVIFAELAVHWVHTSTTLSFTRYNLPGWHLGEVVWVTMAVFVLVAASNAVNLTDGLDGLAAGSAAMGFAVLAIIGYWQFRHFSIYQLPNDTALDLGLVAIALAGGCIGFLWWNAAPARIIMGDTGSLALGAGLAGLCLLQNLDLLLVIIGGLFVIETLSVIAQVISFRVFHRRVFKMAPIHHHFELLGWPQTTVTVRFWIIDALFVVLALGLFYGDWVKVALPV